MSVAQKNLSKNVPCMLTVTESVNPWLSCKYLRFSGAKLKPDLGRLVIQQTLLMTDFHRAGQIMVKQKQSPGGVLLKRCS